MLKHRDVRGVVRGALRTSQRHAQAPRRPGGELRIHRRHSLRVAFSSWSRKRSGSSALLRLNTARPVHGLKARGSLSRLRTPFGTSKFRRRAGSRIEPSPHISSQCNGEVTWLPRVRSALRHMQRGRVWAPRRGACPKGALAQCGAGLHGGEATWCNGHVICQTTERSLQVRRAARRPVGARCVHIYTIPATRGVVPGLAA